MKGGMGGDCEVFLFGHGSVCVVGENGALESQEGGFGCLGLSPRKRG